MSRSLRLSALALALAACHADEAEPTPAPPTVKVVTVARRPIAARTPIAGVLAPRPGKDVKVGALVQGRVDRMLVAEGDTVTAGQALAHVEAQPLLSHVSEAEAQKSAADAALVNARTRLARAERLYQDGIAAKQEVDDARAAVIAAESGVKQAVASGGLAGVQLDRATLRSPIAGVVAAILVPLGQPVEGNATPVVEIADLRVLDLRAPLPASRVGAISVGQKAELTVDGAGAVAGEVEAIAPLVDPLTNTVVVRIKIPNPNGRLRGGAFARGAILGAAHDGVAVPRSALLPGEGAEANQVAVVGTGGRVAHRALELGAEAGDEVEVRAGLEPGARVIVSGGYALPDGARVEIAP